MYHNRGMPVKRRCEQAWSLYKHWSDLIVKHRIFPLERKILKTSSKKYSEKEIPIKLYVKLSKIVFITKIYPLRREKWNIAN